MVEMNLNQAEKDMITVIDRERIRRAYYIEGQSMRQIAKTYHHSYWTIRKALDTAEQQPYTRKAPKPAPKLGPYNRLFRLREKAPMSVEKST